MSTKYEIAFMIWNILADVSKSKQTITYKLLANKVNMNFIPASFHGLHEIQNYCEQENLPPLTMLAVGMDGRQGEGFRKKRDDGEIYNLDDVYLFDWHGYGNPYMFTSQFDNIDKLTKSILKEPDKSHEIYKLISNRGYQQVVFRKALLKAYSFKCTICRTAVIDVLEAAHIEPWSECDASKRIDPRNGILLCSNHHKLFDKEKVKFNEDGRIIFSDDVISSCDCDFTQVNAKYHNQVMVLPKDKDLYPHFINQKR